MRIDRTIRKLSIIRSVAEQLLRCTHTIERKEIEGLGSVIPAGHVVL